MFLNQLFTRTKLFFILMRPFFTAKYRQFYFLISGPLLAFIWFLIDLDDHYHHEIFKFGLRNRGAFATTIIGTKSHLKI